MEGLDGLKIFLVPFIVVIWMIVAVVCVVMVKAEEKAKEVAVKNENK